MMRLVEEPSKAMHHILMHEPSKTFHKMNAPNKDAILINQVI